MSKQEILPAQPVRQSLVAKIAAKYSVESEKMLGTLKETVFKNATNEQLMALLVVSDQYDLNPFTKEIYAFPSQGGIVPIVGIDGWISIVNRQPTLKSIEFKYSEEEEKGIAQFIECVITRSDRNAPIVAREYFEECYRETGPWKSHPRRMLRHKAFVQAARLAYGFSGIYDPDEAERIIEATAIDITNRKPATEAPVERTPEPKRIEAKPEPAPAEETPKAPEGLVEDAPPMRAATDPVRFATKRQLDLVRKLLYEKKASEEQLCAAFDVDSLETLEFDTVDAVYAYIKKMP